MLQGSFQINNSIDVATITPYSEITGDLVLSAAGLTSISLPNLCKVDGVVRGTDPDLITLDLPALTSVGALGVESAGHLLTLNALTNLNAPSLASAPLGIDINVGPGATVSLPSLTGTLAQIYVNEYDGNPQASTSLSVPLPISCMDVRLAWVDATLGLATGGFIALGGATLDAPSLTMVDRFYITEASSASVPALVTVTGDMLVDSDTFTTFDMNLQEVGTLTFTNNSALTTITLNALTSGTITLGAEPLAGCSKVETTSSNPSLVQLTAPLWTSGVVEVWDYTFPGCRGAAICAQLSEASGTGQCGCFPNQATSPCP